VHACIHVALGVSDTHDTYSRRLGVSGAHGTGSRRLELLRHVCLTFAPSGVAQTRIARIHF
jgi:hypothetical protein